MCAIYGIAGKYDQRQVINCIQSMSHRGPDAIEVKHFDEISLAHARLAILDLSKAGNQPMSYLGERYWIVFNGEIYNFIELKKELMRKGYQFWNDTDTEVILAAYHEWGSDFQNKCNGMWAVAIWDTLKKELFLSRDRFGIKPLYLYRGNGFFAFASEMKAFFPIMKKREVNAFIFENRGFFLYESGKECLIKGIENFPAGHCVVYKEGQLTWKKWWNTKDHLTDVPDTYKGQVRKFRELFFDACRIRMRSDVPIGTALSGGVDSSAVIGALHFLANRSGDRIAKDWQNAFVAQMDGCEIDETDYAKKAGKYIGIDVEGIKLTPRISTDELLKYLYLCEYPYDTSPIPFIQTYKGIRDRGIKVTIDGHGADELFGGYEFDLPYAGLDVLYQSDRKNLKKLRKIYNEQQMYEKDKLSDEQFYQLVMWCKGEASFSVHDKPEFFNTHLYKVTHETILPTLLRCYDRYSMANGVEIRMPFMDYRVVTFAFSIPYTSKVRNGFLKSIVRDAMKGYMDNKILYRKNKIGFNAPLSEWFHGELKEFLLDTIYSRDFMECDLVNPIETTLLVEQFMGIEKEDFGLAVRIWGNLVPYLWKKAMIDGKVVE